MNILEMPRKPRLFRLDDRVLDKLDELAESAGTNTNQFVESILFDFLKHAGKLPKESDQLKDGRGGSRKNSGRKRKEAPQIDIPEPTIDLNSDHDATASHDHT